MLPKKCGYAAMGGGITVQEQDKKYCLICVNKHTETALTNVDNPPAYNAIIANKKRRVEEILRSFLPEDTEVINDLWENFDIKVV